MNPVTLQVGNEVVDTVQTITATMAETLFQKGYKGVVRYVTSLSVAEVQVILTSGLRLGIVTYADRFNAAETLLALAKLGIPKGVHVFLDVEGVATMPVQDLISKINTWAHAISAAGYIPAMYVGAGMPLDAQQLYYLAVRLYWHSCSRVIEPLCGYAMIQLHPGNLAIGSGILVDISTVQQDYAGRLPVFVGA